MKPELRSCHYIQEAKDALKKAGKQPQEVVKDYLSLVWAYTLESMHKHLTKALVDELPFRVVLTVPATWATIPNASERLYQAAQQAGIRAKRPCGDTELDIVAEPEAAAFATLVDARIEGEIEVRYFDSNLYYLSARNSADNSARMMIYS
jgi:molecular chaperone DnaK (HSP70)